MVDALSATVQAVVCCCAQLNSRKFSTPSVLCRVDKSSLCELVVVKTADMLFALDAAGAIIVVS